MATIVATYTAETDATVTQLAPVVLAVFAHAEVIGKFGNVPVAASSHGSPGMFGSLLLCSVIRSDSRVCRLPT